MCGITGFCDFGGTSTRDDLARMTAVLSHRGPDDEGHFWQESDAGLLGLGHRRLSILDLSQLGHQPMESEDGNYRLILNGEIYNFREIARDLEREGFTFKSRSDTEVVLKAFMHWGADAVNRFVGMFAFAVHDRARERLTLVRDRAGVKPLYYYWNKDLFLFASELKSLHEHPRFEKELDHGALQLFLRYQFVPAPHTIFRNTFKLQAGHYLEIDLRKRSIREQEYWSVLDAYNAPKLEITEEEALDELETLLDSAFGYRMISDVPVGVFLSGGYDSATVAAVLQKGMSDRLRTFTIGFAEDGFDEAPHARALAEHLGTEHVEHYCTAQDAAGIIGELPEIFDEPFADASAVPTILVSRIARQHVKVALSADGGDETFAGYSRYTRHADLFRRLGAIPRPLAGLLRPLVKPFSKLPGIRGSHAVEARAQIVEALLAERDRRALYRHKIEPLYYTRDEIRRLMLDPVAEPATGYDEFDRLDASNQPLDRMLAIDYRTYMADDVLVKVDRAGMSTSLEGREPLLDHRIVEFAARLPLHLKHRDGTGKYLLRKLLHRYVPAAMMDRPKQGFGAPIEYWFDRELRELLHDHLGEARLRSDGLFDADEVLRLRDSHVSRNQQQFQRVWTVLMFQMWKERWL